MQQYQTIKAFMAKQILESIVRLCRMELYDVMAIVTSSDLLGLVKGHCIHTREDMNRASDNNEPTEYNSVQKE